MHETKTGTHVIVHVLPANMQQRVREVARGHLEPVVERPQRRAEARRDAREPAARRRVRLEHDERLPRLLRDLRRVEVGRDRVHAHAVVEVPRELRLRVFRVAEPRVQRCAVVVGVAARRNGNSACELCVRGL